MLMNICVVGISGSLGAVTRYLVYLWANSRVTSAFPWATLAINVSGCLLIGMIGALIERAVPFHRQLSLIGAVGFLGSYTTFSAFGLETFNLLRSGFHLSALLNIFANLALGILAVGLGRALALGVMSPG